MLLTLNLDFHLLLFVVVFSSPMDQHHGGISEMSIYWQNF